MRLMVKTALVGCVLATLAVSFSYAEPEDSQPMAADEKEMIRKADTPDDPLAGEWIVKELAEAKIPTGVKALTLTIKQDGSVAGFGGVNRFFGKLATDGKKLFGPIGSTRKAGPAEAMKIESTFFKALEKATASNPTDEQLELLDSHGKVLMKFVKAPAKPALTGEWVLHSLSGEAIPAEIKTPTLTINEDGSLAGFGGVNRFFGKVAADDKKLFGPIGSTMMAGPPEAMKVESQLFQAFEKATRATSADGKLQLLDSADQVLAEFTATK